MTFEQIKASNAAMLTPAQVAEAMHMAPHVIRLMARDKELPFPYIRSGSRTHIPREGFIHWMEGATHERASLGETWQNHSGMAV